MFDTKSWHNSLKPKIFRNPKLMTHWWVPLRSFSALSDKKFWQKIVIFPPPLLFLSFFETRNFQKHRSERFLYEIFRHCETKFSTQNRDITLWSLKSFETRNYWHTDRFPYEVFRHCQTKCFDRKSWSFPPPRPLILIFFRDQNFSEAQIRKVSLRNFSALWDNMFDTKSWHNSLKPKIFRNPKLMTHWWVPLRSFSALSDKKFWQKIVIFPPPALLFLSFFETRNFQKHRSERFLYEIFRHCETKFSTQNRDITLSSLKSFDNRN